MEENEVKHFKRIILGGTLLIGLGLLIQFFDQSAWFNIIFRVEKAISSRDSGHLILASAQMSFLYSVQTTFLFLGSILIIYYTGISLKFNKYKVIMVSLLAIIFFNVSISLILDIPWEPVTTILSLVVVMAILERFFRERNSFLHLSIVSIQVFYAFQWLNIMPLFSGYWIGQTDIPYSIKISGIYLNAASVLNFAGFAFFIPFIFSAFITTTLFISNRNNINIMRENYEKESKIQSMNAKILENRISNEVNSLVHDLKTPLVTIRGLNSLLAITVDHGKVKEYSGRIENSANKMNEMISSFLYDTSRQRLKAAELINYIRAQFPLEDDSIFIEIKISEKLPDLFVNKVRVARAVINILENAIIVPCKESNKHIIFEVKPVDYGLHIIVQDNGTGIKESDLTKIFEVGYSTNNTSGLGLSFAKQIIEDNKGSIEILSKHNEGTCVTIFLPKFYSDSDEVSDVN